MARIEIPQSAKELITLFEHIYAKHLLDGVDSPLKNIFNMDNLHTKSETANQLNENALEANRQKENFYEQRDIELKVIKVELRRMRDYLLSLFPDNPHKLGEWGYEVQDVERKEKPKNN